MERRECRRREKIILLYQEGELSPRQARKAAQHLEGCAYCRKVAEEYRLLKKELYSRGEIPVGPLVFPELKVADDARALRPRGVLRWAGVATAGLVLLLAAGIMRFHPFRNGDYPDQPPSFLAVENALVSADYYYLLLLERLPQEERSLAINLVANN